MRAETLATLMGTGILILLFLSVITFGGLFPSVALGEDTYIIGHGVGISMLPYIKPGDYLIIDVTPEKIDLGDVIVYRYNGELIGHRVIRITDDGYIVQGDNVDHPDPVIVTDDMVFGEVERVISNPILQRVAELWLEKKELSFNY